MSVATAQTLPEIAFYYPNPMWRDGAWVKNLILFFDGIGLLVPDYMRDRVEHDDPAVFVGLEQANLLHIFEPEQVVDKVATERLATAMVDIIASGALDNLGKTESRFAEISMSRLGYLGDIGLAKMLHEELTKRNLAGPSKDGVSIPMHAMVRSLVLVLLSQILRQPGHERGFDLAPATDMPRLVDALREFLSIPMAPSAGHVVSFDLNAVGVDLGRIPMDEVLAFRQEHLEQHRAYAQSVRLFVHELSLMPLEIQAIAFERRQAEIDDLAASLRRVGRKAWKAPAAFTLSMLGASWTLALGNPLGALLAGAGAIIKGGASEKPSTGAYTYLFQSPSRYF